MRNGETYGCLVRNNSAYSLTCSSQSYKTSRGTDNKSMKDAAKTIPRWKFSNRT